MKLNTREVKCEYAKHEASVHTSFGAVLTLSIPKTELLPEHFRCTNQWIPLQSTEAKIWNNKKLSLPISTVTY